MFHTYGKKPGELQEVSPVPRWNIQAFLSNAGPAFRPKWEVEMSWHSLPADTKARPLEACSEESEISEEARSRAFIQTVGIDRWIDG